MSAEEKSTQGGKVIEGAVGAEAGAAGVALNQGVKYTIQEVVHHRLAYDPSNGQEVGRETMIEFVVTSGEPPKGFHQFNGLGTLEANIPAPGHPPGTMQQHREQYRFPVEGTTLEEAWSLYADCSGRGAENAKADFRRRYAAMEEQLRKQLLVPGGQGKILGPGGQPLS